MVVGDQYWIADKTEIYRLVELVSVDDAPWVTVKDIASANVSKATAFQLLGADARDVDDMTQLYHIHEASILANLEQRAALANQRPYTNIASVLVAMNPLRWLEPPKPEEYINRSGAAPHPYAVAEAAFRAMTVEPDAPQSQSVVISGESGAGKTETSKIILFFLTVRAKGLTGGSVPEALAAGLDARLLQSNVVLEAFGNAKTLRNDNSSRFGKFMKVQFRRTGDTFHLAGAAIETYLLEKSRLVFQPGGERNFHVFYQLLAAATAGVTDAAGIEPALRLAAVHHYLNQSGCTTVSQPGEGGEAGRFSSLCEAMETLGIAVADRAGMFRTLGAILALGNVSFDDETTGEGEKAILTPGGPSEGELAAAGALLGVGADQLLKVLREKTLKSFSKRGSVYYVARNAEAAKHARDAMCKLLFVGIFDELVRRIATALGSSEAAGGAALPSIGVLDIFGFESFTQNGFEQLCINFANESLQATFNRAVFVSEQELYRAEMVSTSMITPPDSSAVLELIAGKPNGILALLEQTARAPEPSDAKWLESLHRIHGGSRSRSGRVDATEPQNVASHQCGDPTTNRRSSTTRHTS